MKCLAAHTSLGYKNYPAYINASRQGDGSVRVIVRSQEDVACAQIVMSSEEWDRWLAEAVKSTQPTASA